MIFECSEIRPTIPTLTSALFLVSIRHFHPLQHLHRAIPRQIAMDDALVPGLPDDVSTLILLSLPIPHQLRLRSTSRRWSSLLSPSTSFRLRLSLRLPPRPLLCLFPSDPSIISPLLFCPLSLSFLSLPPLPCSPFSYNLTKFSPIFLPPFIYLIGGSLFDTRSYPLDHPSSSNAVFRFDLSTNRSVKILKWERVSGMNSPRGSFACARTGDKKNIVVAGGGSSHSVYPSSHGSPISSVERYDSTSNKWENLERLPKFRAGCVGFAKTGTDEEEFWVMGGYGKYVTLSGIVPSNVYYRDAVVLGLKTGKWRAVPDMLDEKETVKLGPLAVLEGIDGLARDVFMLDNNQIFRYDFDSNSWTKETGVRKKVVDNESCGFAAMNGAIYVLTSDSKRPYTKRPTLEVQAYSLKKKKWILFVVHPPMFQPINFKSTILCTLGI